MNAPLGRAGSRWLTGVLGTLAAGLLFAPAAARADCGDYVTIGGHAATPVHTTSPESPRPLSVPRDGDKPCSGPRCSGGTPVAPLAPVIPPAPPRGDDSGLAFAASASDADSPAAERRDDRTSPRPVRFAATVYHPPR